MEKMSLLQMQMKFMRMLPRLIDRAHELGYECSEGDAFRDPRTNGAVGVQMGYGHKNSNHKNKLAFDLNLYKDSKYLEGNEAHRVLGEWWESQGGTWGGRFSDGNHYSLEFNGMK